MENQQQDQEQALKSVKGLTNALRFLLISHGMLAIASAVASLFVYYSFAQMPSDTIYDSVSVTAETLWIIVDIFRLIALFALCVSFGLWVYRMNYNLRRQTTMAMGITPAWAVGWYFVPLANLIMPYQAMKEIYRASHKRAEVSVSPVTWWWAIWLVSTGVNIMVIGLRPEVVTIRDAMDEFLLASFAQPFAVALDIVALILVNGVWQAYKRNYLEVDLLLDYEATRPTMFG